MNNGDIQLSSSPDAVANAKATPVSISVNANGQIWGGDGLIAPARLSAWLTAEAKRAPGSTLLVIGDERASMDVYTQISVTAKAAGFVDIQLAMQQATPGSGLKP